MKLRALLENATPGPWRAEAMGSEGYFVWPPRGERGWIAKLTNREWEKDKADAALIVHLRNLAPLYVALEEAARGWLSWSDDGEPYVEAEVGLLHALAALAAAKEAAK